MSETEQPQSLTPEQEKENKLLILAVNLRVAKEAESRTKKSRIAIEQVIAAEIPSDETGQKTVTLSNGTKITVKRGLSYKADLNEVQGVFNAEGPQDLIAPIKAKTTRELDVKGYEWYRANHPTLFAQLTQYVTITPRKVAVTLKEAS